MDVRIKNWEGVYTFDKYFSNLNLVVLFFDSIYFL